MCSQVSSQHYLYLIRNSDLRCKWDGIPSVGRGIRSSGKPGPNEPICTSPPSPEPFLYPHRHRPLLKTSNTLSKCRKIIQCPHCFTVWFSQWKTIRNFLTETKRCSLAVGFKLFAAAFSFFTAGAKNDCVGRVGGLIPIYLVIMELGRGVLQFCTLIFPRLSPLYNPLRSAPFSPLLLGVFLQILSPVFLLNSSFLLSLSLYFLPS